MNDPQEERLEFLSARMDLVTRRDDLSTEVAALFNLLNRPERALQLIEGRRFHPWEGGEGQVLRQYTASRIKLGRKALHSGLADQALMHFESAYDPPPSLGEAYHYLQAKADVNYWKGRAYRALHEPEKARAHFEMSATETGDFLEMSVTEHSPLTFYRGLSLAELGRPEQAKALFESLATYARNMKAEPATIDYFTTSLPLMLVFDEDLQARKQVEAVFLLGLAQRGLGDLDSAIDLSQKFSNGTARTSAPANSCKNSEKRPNAPRNRMHRTTSSYRPDATTRCNLTRQPSCHPPPLKD
jgi:tetratricopeptide (TPR) repeat protein